MSPCLLSHIGTSTVVTGLRAEPRHLWAPTPWRCSGSWGTGSGTLAAAVAVPAGYGITRGRCWRPEHPERRVSPSLSRWLMQGLSFAVPPQLVLPGPALLPDAGLSLPGRCTCPGRCDPPFSGWRACYLMGNWRPDFIFPSYKQVKINAMEKNGSGRLSSFEAQGH